MFENLYGTLRGPMEAALAQGRVYLVEIDVQGALQLKGLEVPGLYVFIAPPDDETLRGRLQRIRSQDAEAGILVITEGLFSMDSDVPDIVSRCAGPQ